MVMKCFAAWFLVFSFYSIPAFAAQPPEATLPPVFVTSTRTETPLEQVTTSATIITAQDIENQRAETVLEVLRQVPGFDVVQSGSRGTGTSIFVRGAEADQVLVLIDGVEVNSTTAGAFNFAHLTTENIERIEIIRGAGGTLYGSQAIGGVINIITKRGRGPMEFGLSAEGGNGWTHRQTLNLSGEVGKFGYSLSGARIESDGFRPFNDDYRNVAASGRLDYKFTEDALLKGIFRFNKTDVGLFNSNNFVPGGRDPNSREAVTQYLGKVEWEQRILKEWDYRIAGSIFKEHIKDSDDPDPLEDCQFFGFPCDSRTRSRFRPQISSAEFQTNYRFGDWSTTTFGTEFKRRKASTSSSSDGVSLGEINKAIRNIGYYLQEQIKLLGDRLILIPGIRLDDHQTFGTEWSPSFSSSYLFRETGTRVKAGYAEAFKAPTLNELFFPAGFGCAAFGNPDLGPEKSWELNAGVEQNLFGDRVTVGATFFHREVSDLISTGPTPDPTDPAFCVRAENLGKARFDGVEWTMNIKLLSFLALGANYTYLDWDTQDGRLSRRPRHRGSLNLNYFYDRFRLNFDAHLIGKRDDIDSVTGSNIKKGGYARFDLAGSYQLPVKITLVKDVTVFGKIENLFNRKYEEADGFRARPLNFLLGVRAVFGS
jgi:vitamin B12 transporter